MVAKRFCFLKKLKNEHNFALKMMSVAKERAHNGNEERKEILKKTSIKLSLKYLNFKESHMLKILWLTYYWNLRCDENV